MHLMKLIQKLAILMASVLLPCATKADTLTLVATNASSASFNVPSNDVAQVVYAYGQPYDASISLTIGGATVTYRPNTSLVFTDLPIVTGPATISITNSDTVDSQNPNDVRF